MLPVGTMSSMMYPMIADIYYPTVEQNAIGEMERTWRFDRQIRCSAIKERPSSRMANAMQAQRFIEYDFSLDFRTDEDILISSDDEVYAVSDVVLTNIRDSAGTLVWFEKTNYPTSFEVRNIEPMFDPFHNLFGYRIYLKRSDAQVEVRA